MSRNKYPEETVEKILQAGATLFMEKGYEKTSLQDIVNSIHMSKGAFYHHFQSKEELLQRITGRYFANTQWCDEIMNNPSLNGLEKLRALFMHELDNEEKKKMDLLTRHVIADPKILEEQLKSGIQEVAPMIDQLIQEGIKDGSLHTKYTKQVSEVLVLTINFWINPGVFNSTKEEFMEKVYFLKYMLDRLELPMIDDTLLSICSNYYDTTIQN